MAAGFPGLQCDIKCAADGSLARVECRWFVMSEQLPTQDGARDHSMAGGPG